MDYLLFSHNMTGCIIVLEDLLTKVRQGVSEEIRRTENPSDTEGSGDLLYYHPMIRQV